MIEAGTAVSSCFFFRENPLKSDHGGFFASHSSISERPLNSGWKARQLLKRSRAFRDSTEVPQDIAEEALRVRMWVQRERWTRSRSSRGSRR